MEHRRTHYLLSAGILLPALLVMLCGLSACNKNNNSTPTTTTPPVSTSNGTITAVVNGASWTSIKNSAMLTIHQSQGISGCVINAESAADFIAVGIDIPTTSSLVTTGAHDFKGQNDDLLITYSLKNSSGGLTTQHFPKQAASTISSVDNVNKKVSGTFSFMNVKSNAQNSADTIRVTNGVFTDINFTVVNQ